MLPRTLSRGKTLPISIDYMLRCLLPCAQSRNLLSCRSQARGGGWWVADGAWCMVAEIMMSVEIIVWTLYLARALWQDLMMPYGHGVDNCSLRLRRKHRQFELGESRSLTKIFRRNQLLASHRLWVYVCAFGLRLMEMMAMAMAMAIAIVMVLVIVIIVPEILRQVGWLHQCQYQSFYRLRAFY